MSLQTIIGHLDRLVACDTQNPPRLINADSGIFKHCQETVGKRFQVRTWDHGDGHVSWFAIRGKPRILFNVHLDTVPAGEGWSFNPMELQLREGGAFGLGACDIKGAAAVLLTLVQQGAENLALLFTTDEEGAGGCCVEHFLQSGEADRFEQVVVAEPTECKAALAHRGFLSVKTRFFGVPGHSSEARALTDNANHQMARWAASALNIAASSKSDDLDPGSCLNLGIISGGTKSNVIAGEALVHWSARLKPGESNEQFLRQMKASIPPTARVVWEVPYSGEPLPAAGRDAALAMDFCDRAGLPRGKDVDFWTEAALFSAAGLPALVLGPGAITQAHTADEWVALAQLEQAFRLYGQLVQADG
ncbi:MAG TPA: acetylornithine deacetylase [Xanthomonadales bacterium]|nr:acetylornithine deacetylase [Xanthomonadales bacterium]